MKSFNYDRLRIRTTLFLFIVWLFMPAKSRHTNNTYIINDEETDSLMRYDEENMYYDDYFYEEESEYNYIEQENDFNESDMVDAPEYWESQGIEPEEWGY